MQNAAEILSNITFRLSLYVLVNYEKCFPEWVGPTTTLNDKSENHILELMTMELMTYIDMDRSWMNARRISQEYEKGVEEFLRFACENGKSVEGKYFCTLRVPYPVSERSCC